MIRDLSNYNKEDLIKLLKFEEGYLELFGDLNKIEFGISEPQRTIDRIQEIKDGLRELKL